MRLARPIKEPAIGMRVVMCPNSYSSKDLEVWVVSRIDENGLAFERNEDGETREIVVNRNLHGAGRHAVWTHAVPEIGEMELQPILRMLGDSSHSKHVFVFTVGEKEEDGHVLHPFGWESEGRILIAGEHVQRKLPSRSFDFHPDDPAIPIEQGMHVLLRPRRTRDGSSSHIVVTECEIAHLPIDAQELEALLETTEGPFGTPVWPVGGQEAFDMEIGQYLAGHDADMIIVLCIETGSIEKPDDTKVVLHSQGSKLYWSDNLNDDVWNASIGHGVWLGTGISWHDCGEDGAEWEADWTKASIGDIAAIIPLSELREHYVDLVEGEPGWGALRALFANTWDSALRTEDETGTPEAAGSVATAWIETLATCEYAAHRKPEIQSENLDAGGRVTTLFLNGRVAATATVVRDEANFSVLTRWVDGDYADWLFQADVKRWSDHG